ncbi:unnamed protein product [Peronospora belbahrii]|uniref:Uncharacterized protein n=1 Tax=Peronospora belbahrii TaxID=622444 RepID=A0ABN8DCQ1_9STRA|nr:unnamed protein product [Peronospora belbahrii]
MVNKLVKQINEVKLDEVQLASKLCAKADSDELASKLLEELFKMWTAKGRVSFNPNVIEDTTEFKMMLKRYQDYQKEPRPRMTIDFNQPERKTEAER